MLRTERRGDVAVLWLDLPGEDVNLLRPEFRGEAERVFQEIEREPDLRAVVIASGKPDNFLAGADVTVLRDLESAADAERLTLAAQETMDLIAEFSRPVVAAIHGACMAGGLELALTCRERVASEHEKTVLGLPEVKVGVFPATGGTQRLPRLVGLEKALDLILTGKVVPARKAEMMGLVDEVVHPAILLEVAIERARRLADGAAEQPREAIGNAVSVQRLRALLLEDNPAGRALVFNQARKQVLSRTHGKMPAPLRAIEVIRRGIEDGPEAGQRAAAEAFGELVVGPEAKSLIGLFLAREALKKEKGADAEPLEVHKVGVLGAGLMGSGIAAVSAMDADLPVRMKDVDHDKLRTGLRSIRKALTERAKKEQMSEQEQERVLHLIRPTTEYTGFGRAGVVIEAVVEDLELKHKVLRELEEHAGPETIFASNTSALPIQRIAEASDRPEQVIGMHYFSPADKVPLLEVVVSERTAPSVTATCVALGKRQGKTVIVVNDGAGFYITRILSPFLAEAAHLLKEGVSIKRIDEALEEFGFPVGPFQLLDEVGIDVAHKIGGILRDAFGERMAPAGVLERMLEDERQGKKNGRGFYRYQQQDGGFFERKDEEVDEEVYRLLDLKPEAERDPEEIALRCTLALVNEAVRCYEDGILRCARDGDVGAVFGLGFPPYLGGPFRFIDQRGPGDVLALLERYQTQVGERFEPAPLLRVLAERGVVFHSDAAPQPGELPASPAST